MTARAERRSGFFESQCPDFAMRQMTSTAFSLFCGFMREFAFVVLCLMTFQAILLLTEARAAFDLRFSIRIAHERGTAQADKQRDQK